MELLESRGPKASWTRDQKLSYWINLYNAVTLQLVTKHFPIKSIRDIAENPWKIKLVTVNGKALTLDQIENEIIRPRFNDARIHFAVNCAAASCPPLLNEAFVASTLGRQLEKQTKSFINNRKYNEITKDGAKVSKIFEWYAVDFGNLVTYINRYSSTQVKANGKISYLEYDWGLND